MGPIDGDPSADDDQAITDTKNDLGHGLLGQPTLFRCRHCVPCGQPPRHPVSSHCCRAHFLFASPLPRKFFCTSELELIDVARETVEDAKEIRRHSFVLTGPQKPWF